MKTMNRARWLVAGLSVVALAGCSSSGGGVGPNNSCANGDILSGMVTDDCRLSAGTYHVNGLLTVEDGGELHIAAGTTLLGSTTITPSAVIVKQGGKIFSEGTAANPVVMTSDLPVGQRRPGDWGGLAIQGYSNCNFEEDPCVSEGVGLPYGGNNPNDDSGVVAYTRVEYCGYEVTFGNELNCVTLNGVGAGTELHHIQAHRGSDDGFEWFGGTVDLQYAVSTLISDDSFDYSSGWQGRGQFWIAQQDPDDADHLYEVDGNEITYTLQPYTLPTIYNATLVGGGVPCGGDTTNGMLQRRGTGGHLFNHIITQACSFGFDVDDQETVNRINDGSFYIKNSIVFGNARNFENDNDGIDEESIWKTAAWNNQEVDPRLVDPLNRVNPDFRLQAGSPAASGNGATPPNDGFFDTSATCIGAVCGQTEWYEGWTTHASS